MVYPKLYNRDGELLAVLDNIIHDTAKIKKVLNGEFNFTFEVPESELKSGYLSDENVVVVDGYQFDIKYVEYIRNHEIRYKVLCEHINYRLGDGEENKVKNWDPEEPKDNYLELGTPTFHLTKILEGTEFTVGEVYDFDLYEEDEEGEPQPTDEITLQASGDTTRRELLKDLARIVGGELEFSGDGFTVNLLNIGGIGENRGFEARFGKNLLGVTKFIDRRGGLEVNYTVDIVELKNSKDYIENDLGDLEKINVGDIIRIVDDTIGLDVENRIVSVEYDPINAVNTHIEIENQVDNIAKYVERIRTTTVQTEREYNNVSISSDYGFRAERNDRKAKIQMNATTGLEVRTRSDIEESYSSVLTIDNDGNLIMTGVINVVPGGSGLGNLAYEDSIDLFDSEKITSIPNAIKAPSGKGLFISDTHLGFHDDTFDIGWRTYMDDLGNFYLGGSDGALQWNSGSNELKIEGQVIITGGSGIDQLEDAGNLAKEDSIDLFDSEKITSIPNAIKAPSGKGLFISDTHLGFHDDTFELEWRTYMDHLGNFYLGGSDGSLQWNSGSNELKIEGQVIITGGSGIDQLEDAGNLAKADDLDDVSDGSTYKRTTSNEKIGAIRAWDNLDEEGDLISRVKPSQLMGIPSQDGLYHAKDYLGFYDTEDGWTSFIKNDGTFKFQGNNNNFIEWDNENLNIQGGIVTNGSIQGGTIAIGYGEDPPFQVNSSGGLTATSATIIEGDPTGERLEISELGLVTFNDDNEEDGVKIDPQTRSLQFTHKDSLKGGVFYNPNVGEELSDGTIVEEAVVLFGDTLVLNPGNITLMLGDTRFEQEVDLWGEQSFGYKKIMVGPYAPEDENAIWIDTT